MTEPADPADPADLLNEPEGGPATTEPEETHPAEEVPEWR
jgi:hypothetical protein